MVPKEVPLTICLGSLKSRESLVVFIPRRVVGISYTLYLLKTLTYNSWYIFIQFTSDIKPNLNWLPENPDLNTNILRNPYLRFGLKPRLPCDPGRKSTNNQSLVFIVPIVTSFANHEKSYRYRLNRESTEKATPGEKFSSRCLRTTHGSHSYNN